MWIVKIFNTGDHYSTKYTEVGVPGFKEGETVYFAVKPLFEGKGDVEEYGNVGQCVV
jgi:hypothetical protein